MIDWVHLRELIEEFGARDFKDLIVDFWVELDDAIDALGHIAPDDGNGIAAQMHFIKGAAANLGLVDLAALTDAQEKSAKQGQLDAIDIAKAEQVYTQSKIILREQGRARLGIRLG